MPRNPLRGHTDNSDEAAAAAAVDAAAADDPLPWSAVRGSENHTENHMQAG